MTVFITGGVGLIGLHRAYLDFLREHPEAMREYRRRTRRLPLKSARFHLP